MYCSISNNLRNFNKVKNLKIAIMIENYKYFRKQSKILIFILNNHFTLFLQKILTFIFSNIINNFLRPDMQI
jgi:hypothetical protein